MTKQVFSLAALFGVLATIPLVAQSGHGLEVAIAARLKGAERVVVARVAAVSAAYQRNQWGDELIVSQVDLAIEEELKGRQPRAAKALRMELEGGTVGDITLSVSDLPALTVGERAVFILTKKQGVNVYLPYLRGHGILMLDARNQVKDVGLSLDDIRQMIGGAQ